MSNPEGNFQPSEMARSSVPRQLDSAINIPLTYRLMKIPRYEDERLPFLLELNPDGSDIPNGAGVRHRLQPNVTEVGSERPIGPQAVQAQTLTLPGPTVMPRHCVIAFTENIVTLTPCSRDAHTYVNNQRIHQTTILQACCLMAFAMEACTKIATFVSLIS